MPDIIRVNDGPEFGFDSDGNRTARETFIVTDSQPASAAPLVLADFGTVHPELGLPFQRLSTARYAGNGARVVLEFGNGDGGGGVDDLGDDFSSSSVTYRAVTTDYPVMVRVESGITLLGDDGVTEEPAWFWDFDKNSPQAVTLPHSVLTYRTTFSYVFPTVVSGFQQLAPIMAKAGDLHQIGNVYYEFEPRIIHQETPTKWRVEYNWIQDRGIPLEIPDAASRTPVNGWTDLQAEDEADFQKVLPLAIDDQGLYGPAGKRYIRLPYHDIEVRPTEEANPTILPYAIQQLRNNADDLLGWQSLPGVS